MLQLLLTSVGRLVLQAEGHNVVPALAWHIASAMFYIEQARWRSGHGTLDARRYRNVSIPVPTWKVKALDIVLSILLFGAHRTYRNRLESARPGGFVFLPEFRELMKSLLVEWTGKHIP